VEISWPSVLPCCIFLRSGHCPRTTTPSFIRKINLVLDTWFLPCQRLWKHDSDCILLHNQYILHVKQAWMNHCAHYQSCRKRDKSSSLGAKRLVSQSNDWIEIIPPSWCNLSSRPSPKSMLCYWTPLRQVRGLAVDRGEQDSSRHHFNLELNNLRITTSTEIITFHTTGTLVFSATVLIQ